MPIVLDTEIDFGSVLDGECVKREGDSFVGVDPSTWGSLLNLPFIIGFDSLGLTNHTQAEAFLGNTDRHATKVDLSNYSQCRLLVRVISGSASPNSPRLRVRYKTSFSAVVSEYSDVGVEEVSCSLTDSGFIESEWVDLDPLAKADVFIVIGQLGGNSSADPSIGPVSVQFK